MKITLLLFTLVTPFVGHTQNVNIPQKEFAVALSEERITLRRGASSAVEIFILKSKAYKKNEMKMGASLPNGLTISRLAISC